MDQECISTQQSLDCGFRLIRWPFPAFISTTALLPVRLVQGSILQRQWNHLPWQRAPWTERSPCLVTELLEGLPDKLCIMLGDYLEVWLHAECTQCKRSHKEGQKTALPGHLMIRDLSHIHLPTKPSTQCILEEYSTEINADQISAWFLKIPCQQMGS